MRDELRLRRLMMAAAVLLGIILLGPYLGIHILTKAPETIGNPSPPPLPQGQVRSKPVSGNPVSRIPVSREVSPELPPKPSPSHSQNKEDKTGSSLDVPDKLSDIEDLLK